MVDLRSTGGKTGGKTSISLGSHASSGGVMTSSGGGVGTTLASTRKLRDGEGERGSGLVTHRGFLGAGGEFSLNGWVTVAEDGDVGRGENGSARLGFGGGRSGVGASGRGGVRKKRGGGSGVLGGGRGGRTGSVIDDGNSGSTAGVVIIVVPLSVRSGS